MKAPRGLTELEATALGVVWASQPCTPYQVRREFKDSPSPHWSGSAGAIYPVMLRLEAAGLVRSRPHATGKRRSRRYRVTAAGQRAIAHWVRPASLSALLGVPPDPLRTRVAFLGALPASARRALLRAIQRGLEAAVAGERAELERARAHGPQSEAVARGALAMQRARLEWIRALRAEWDPGRIRPGRPAGRPRRHGRTG